MITSMFTTFIAKPIFNLLTGIYALLPGHNFGLAIIIFSVAARLLMWPLLKKQLHTQKAMRELQPDIQRIRKETKGDKQAEMARITQLYKEKEISPFSSLGLLIVQLPFIFALFSGLRKIILDSNSVITFSYGFIRDLPFMKELAGGSAVFDKTLVGLVDLTRPAIHNLGDWNNIYLPAFIIALLSGLAQYYMSKQLMPSPPPGTKKRRLRDLMADQAAGKPVDQSEIMAAQGATMQYLLPVLIFFFTIFYASGLALYLLVSSVVGYFQQRSILSHEVEVLEESAVIDVPKSSVKITRKNSPKPTPSRRKKKR